MNTEQIVKIKVCALRVSIHCDGCKKKVQKVLKKIEGVYKTAIDSEQGKVTVSGDFDPEILIKKLKKHGKRAELWDAPKPNTTGEENQQPIVKVQLDNGKEGKNGSGSGPNGENIEQQQQPQRGGLQQISIQQRMLQPPTQQQMEPPAQQQIQRTPNQQPQQLPAMLPQNPNQQQVQSQQQIQQLRQLQGGQQGAPNQQQRQQLPQLPQMRGLQDMKMPGPNPNQQAARLDGPKGDEIIDDDSDEYDEEEDESDEDDALPPLLPQLNKMKPVMGNVQMPPSMRMNLGMNLGQQIPPQMMRAGLPGNGAPNGGNGASIGAAKAGEGGSGGGNIPVAVNAGSGLGGKTGGGGGGSGGNQIPGASGAGNFPLQMNAASAGDGSGGKKGDGAEAGANQNSGTGGSGGGPNKNGGDGGPQKNASGGGNAGNEQRKVMIDEVHAMPNMTGMRGGAGGLAGLMHNLRPTAQMGPMGMGPPTATQRVPATVPGGNNFFAQAGPETMQLSPYHQQQNQMAGMMLNQQRDYNERFQPMVHPQAPPDVNHMPPYPYHQMPQQLGPFNNYFSEENPASCRIM